MKKLILIPVFFITANLLAQHDRVNDFNNINWIQSINTIGLNKQWSLHLEYQWRRTEGFKNWQQSLLRIGTNYKVNDNVNAHLGYSRIETFSYGDYPIANNGTFSEHRIYEQLNLRQPVSKFLFTHRFRIEQRWLERIVPGVSGPVKDWFFLHRFRYQFRTQYAFYTKGEKQFYGAAVDEIFIGAGKNLGVNIFDQNRLFLLLGVKLNKKVSIETGYMNQTLQQGRRINNSTILQRNNGVVLSTFLHL
ncbi:MAG: DUF2490 domain-containing protein [Chitinophagaceae bacterium]|nr:DUF2490 domain-containing protein [Chitinophagaceae bacterium]